MSLLRGPMKMSQSGVHGLGYTIAMMPSVVVRAVLGEVVRAVIGREEIDGVKEAMIGLEVKYERGMGVNG